MRLAIYVLILALTARLTSAATLDVGEGQPIATLDKALSAAKAGDEIIVHPAKNDQPLAKIAAKIKTPRLTIRSADSAHRVKIDGTGFNYTGAGPVPRAIFQFDPGADGCILDGFDLSHATNDSFNGAGVRINAANAITIRNCLIHDNDMGIMSNGILKDKTGADQLVEGCTIRHNGTNKQPGYNHNLYLGGTSVTVRACEIADSLTGHNLKSRAHQNWIEYNFIHDSANREFDLVDDAGNTDQPDSDTVLLGNLIAKTPNMQGNKTVIHFGQDGKADHTGTLFLFHNTITTSYSSPIVDLSSPGAKLSAFDNLVQTTAKSGTFLTARNNASDKPTGGGNMIDAALAPAAGLVSPLIAWEKIDLPWKTFNRKPVDFQAFIQAGKLAPTDPTKPGAIKQKP